MNNWLAQLQSLVAQNIPTMIVTVASVKGSTPREPGAKMLITPDSSFGTIGGGHLEFKATGIAREQLLSHPVQMLHRFPLGASLGQCCGGLVNLLFEPVTSDAQWLTLLKHNSPIDSSTVMVTAASDKFGEGKLIVTESGLLGSLGRPEYDRLAQSIAQKQLHQNSDAMLRALSVNSTEEGSSDLFLFEPLQTSDFHIVLFGAGHVGKALVNIIQPLNSRITWIDNRDNSFPSGLASNISGITSDCPEDEVDNCPFGCYFLVMTQDHSLDQRICEAILKKSDFRYFGLIGSQTKRRRFEQRLSLRGFAPADLAAMQCPVGVGGINSKQPAAIAVSIAADLLQKHEQIKTQNIDHKNNNIDVIQYKHLRFREERR